MLRTLNDIVGTAIEIAFLIIFVGIICFGLYGEAYNSGKVAVWEDAAKHGLAEQVSDENGKKKWKWRTVGVGSEIELE